MNIFSGSNKTSAVSFKNLVRTFWLMKSISKKIPLLVILGVFSYAITGCQSTLPKDTAYNETRLTFRHNDNELSGALILPSKGIKPFPVVVFVHGDGPVPYDNHGYYKYLWKHLAENGIASYSWSKPGIGSSTGNWLKQSMDDRADEVISAIEMLEQRPDIANKKIGLIGYSQAGWVLPLVAQKSRYPDFMILVGGAINWLRQGDYLGKNRLIREGFSNTQIQQAMACNQSELQVLQPSSTYDDYIEYHKNNSPECQQLAADLMDEERFEFVKLNWRYDAQESLSTVRCPTLGVFGDQDINVDFLESVGEYKRIFYESGNDNLKIKIYPSAQHALFKTEYIDDRRPGVWAAVKMELLGEEVFADGYLDFVARWVKDVVR